MRASAFTLVALLVPSQPVAAFIGGVAPRARLLSTRPSTLTAELARRRAFRAPQPTLTAAKAAEPAKPRKATLSEWGTLLRLCSQDTLLVAFAFVMLVCASAGDVMLPQLQARALNLVLVGSTPRSAQLLALQQLAAMGVATALFTGLRGFAFWLCGANLVRRLRAKLFGSLVRLPQSFHDERSTGELASRLQSDCIKLGDVLSLNVNIVLRQLLQAGGGLAFVWRLNKRLGLVVLLGVLLRTAVSAVYSTLSRRNAKAQTDALALCADVAEQGLSLVSTVRAHGTEDFEGARYAARLDPLLDLQAQQGALYGGVRVVNGALNTMLVSVVLALGGALAAAGVLPRTDLTAFVLYTEFISSASADVADQWTRVQEALGSAAEVFSLLERGEAEVAAEAKRGGPAAALAATDPDDAPCPISSNPAAHRGPRGELLFEGCNFSYPTRPDVQVLKSLQLRVRPGERVALLGSSGSGKSTVMKLTLRFYEPTAGRVLLDGTPLHGMSNAELRSQVAWVPQEPPLFPVSVRENIAYGMPACAQPEVEAAARLANCHDFIAKLPQGYDTVLGQNGASLSGGQKQRVAIARALIRDPAVLLLDEATSALDPESARLVEAALRDASRDRSVVLTTHKLSQARLADRIVVMQHGAIAEEGSHAELVAKRGLYYEMLNTGTGEDDDELT